MSDTSEATQEAFIARYRGDTTLQALMIGATALPWNIFDQGGGGVITPSFPYVYVHPITMTLGTLLTFGQDANDFFMQVDVYTRAQGFSQARKIAARVYQLTHGPVSGGFTLSTGANVLSLFDNRQELEETNDGLTQHIVDRYKLYNVG